MRPTVLLLLMVTLAGCEDRMPGKPREPRKKSEVEQLDDLYAQNCAACHGAAGNLGAAPPLNDRLFLAIVSKADIVKVLREGRPGTVMPSFLKEKGGSLTADEIDKLAGRLLTRWPKAKSVEGVPSYKPVMKNERDLIAGQKVFDRACKGCHGDEGVGGKFDGKAVGAINDHAFLSLTSDQALRRLIITGRPDLGMPTYAQAAGRAKDFAPLTEKDVSDLVSLLVYWRELHTGDDR